MNQEIRIESGLKVDEDLLPGWRRLLRSWIGVHTDYIHSFPAEGIESPWGYRERPQVGLLAAAAFRSGGVSLEEWGTDKKGSSGRNDLWVRLSPETDEEEYFVEAKHGWATLTAIGIDIRRAVGDRLVAATKSAKRLRRGQRPVAVVFVSLCIPQSAIEEYPEWAGGIIDVPLERRRVNAVSVVRIAPPDVSKLRRFPGGGSVAVGMLCAVRLLKG